MARHAAPVSIRRNMLAPSEAVGRAGSMAACLGSGARHVGRTKAHRVGPSADRRDLPSREKRGDAVGLTKRGKGSTKAEAALLQAAINVALGRKSVAAACAGRATASVVNETW